MYAHASFKTGIFKTELPIYDFVLNIEEVPSQNEPTDELETQNEETYLFDQIIYYLKSIQTTD